jgi:ABC-type sugar transport system substrate-binding protein
MIFHRRILSASVCVLAATMLTNCDESEDQRMARMEKAMDNAKITLKYSGPTGDNDPNKGQPQMTPEERAAEDVTKKLILFSASDLSDPFQRVQADLMRAALRTLDGYRYKVFDSKGDVGISLDMLGKAQNQQPVWLIVNPVEDRMSAAVLESMRGAGVHVVAIDQRVPASSCESVVFTDQIKIGRLAGELVVAALKRKATDEGRGLVSGRVVEVRGRDGSYASEARAQGFAEALKAEPGIILVHDAAGDWSPESGKARAQDAIRLQKSFDVVFAHNDSMASGVSEALTAAQMRENVLIVGVDGAGGFNGGLDLLRRSVIDATIWQPMPLEVAFSLIQKSAQDANFKPEPRYEREPLAITPKNIDDFTRGQLQAPGKK